MKRDPAVSSETIQANLMTAAKNEYGHERASELSDQIKHLARMMAGVAQMRLDLRDAPLGDASGQDRNGR